MSGLLIGRLFRFARSFGGPGDKVAGTLNLRFGGGSDIVSKLRLRLEITESKSSMVGACASTSIAASSELGPGTSGSTWASEGFGKVSPGWRAGPVGTVREGDKSLLRGRCGETVGVSFSVA